MIKNYLIILMIFCSTGSFSQTGNIEAEIINYSDTRGQLIEKGRNLIIDRFLVGDIAKVKEVKDYLVKEVQNQDYAVFYPWEYWLLLYWTEDYDELIYNLENFDEGMAMQFQRQIKPSYDMLFEKVLDKSKFSKFQLERGINNSTLSNEKKDFLLLHLKFILSGENRGEISQEEVNNFADDFLQTYSNSRYEEFVRQNIRYRYELSNWGFAFEFFTGYGIFTNDLAGRYKNPFALGFAFDVEYQRMVLYVRGLVGFTALREDLPYSTGVWEKGSAATFALPEASLGYIAVDNEKFKLAPFVGIGGTEISAPQNDREQNPHLEEVELKITSTYTAGINLDFKLPNTNSSVLLSPNAGSYLFIRVRYGYTLPQFEKRIPDLSGNMHYLTIGFGGMGRNSKRVI